ncbi:MULTISPECIES: glycerate kinase [Nostocales]|uniref:Glycerate kinase n=3 Tax=Nostocales TaxID=1161 RepID=A0A8S9TCE0_9CYAN|nr:glycerate kinase [Tolypothrix bouteillei]KAF3890241.1 glycerate kinase [Tolypothrix bouteillei VB521301]
MSNTVRTHNIHFVLAPDSLKGSLSAIAACAAMKLGIHRAMGKIPYQISAVPLADGGEGTVEAFILGIGGEERIETASNPLGDPVQAKWGVLQNGQAVIEMAQASGLTLVPQSDRRPKEASSYGTGQLIRAALDVGCRNLLIGIGGSATTDGGAGALQALGVRLLDADGQELPRGGFALHRLAKIDLTDLDVRLQDTQITVLSDVDNPLCGENGAAYIYGPQKGATPTDVKGLDAALEHFAKIAAATTGRDCKTVKGAGAAGGMGFGLMTFLNAQLKAGIDVVLEATQITQKLETADLVLTAEGSIDVQTLRGKALSGVARVAGAAKNGKGVPVIAFGGTVRLTSDELQKLGILVSFPLPDAPLPLGECIQRAEELLANATERAIRLWLCGFTSSGFYNHR